MSRQIVDLKPNFEQDGSVLYGESSMSKNEDVTVTLNDGSIVVVENGIITVKLPDNQVVSNPVKSVGLGDGKTVGNVMMSVGGAVAVIVPVGTIIGAIVGAAGALISAFSNGNAARSAEQKAGQYDASNLALQSQNSQLDAKIADLQNALVKAKKDLGLNGLNGLGWCLINCAKTKAEAHLKTAKELFDQLTQDQNTRVQILQDLTNEVERIFLKQNKINYFYIGTGLLVVGAVAYLIVKKAKKK